MMAHKPENSKQFLAPKNLKKQNLTSILSLLSNIKINISIKSKTLNMKNKTRKLKNIKERPYCYFD